MLQRSHSLDYPNLLFLVLWKVNKRKPDTSLDDTENQTKVALIRGQSIKILLSQPDSSNVLLFGATT